MKKYLLISLFIFSFLFFKPDFVFAEEKTADIYFFYSAVCPHCAEEEEFLATLERKYSGLDIEKYEVFFNQSNQAIFQEFFDKYEVPINQRGYVPVTFTPNKYFIGFNKQTAQDIENCLIECLGGTGSAQKISIPVLGEVDPLTISLPILTLVLGILDGFNPCAMWVLVMLISMLLSLKSRKKILLVGGVFIFVEGFLYFLFMAAWLNLFLVIGYALWMRILIGAFAIIFGIWRLKEFFTWKPGVCKVVDSSGSEKKLFEKIKGLLKPATVPATILGVIGLAFGVNLIEFFCSAGFPVIYTRILSLQSISGLEYYIYLFFYNILYLLDDLIVFGTALFALNRFNFSDRYNKYSTLVAGLLILILGALLIFKPNLLMFG